MSCNSFVENERLLVNEQGTLNDSASDEQKRAIGHSHVILNFLVNLFVADRLISIFQFRYEPEADSN